jgi:hypothetical protein
MESLTELRAQVRAALATAVEVLDTPSELSDLEGDFPTLDVIDAIALNLFVVPAIRAYSEAASQLGHEVLDAEEVAA